MKLTAKDILCERGNTLLVNDENMVAWLEKDGEVLEISFTPGNYPAMHVTIIKKPATLAKHINKAMKGWTVVKCNIDGVRYDKNGTVI